MTDHTTAVARLRQRLAAGPLPGEAAFAPLSVPGRSARSVAEARAGGAREGAVLALLYPVGGAPHVALTLRRADLRDHAGQVSLPGGRIEAHETPQAAALREASEEVGLRGPVDVLGPLSPLWIPPTNFLVFPIVAAAAVRPPLAPSADEVAALLEVPLAALTAPAARVTARRPGIDGRNRDVPAFAALGHTIWGATAMILAELVAVAGDAG